MIEKPASNTGRSPYLKKQATTFYDEYWIATIIWVNSFPYLWQATFTARNTRMDSKPMAHMMMPLYSTASFLVQANMSMDKGVPILTQKHTTRTLYARRDGSRGQRLKTDVRLKHGEDEHDDEEQDVGGQHSQLVDGFLGRIKKIHSVWKTLKWINKIKDEQERSSPVSSELNSRWDVRDFQPFWSSFENNFKISCLSVRFEDDSATTTQSN